MEEYVEIGLPDKMTMARQFDSVKITRKWFGFQFIFMTIFAVVWNGILYTQFAPDFSIPDLVWLHVVAGCSGNLLRVNRLV